MIPLACGDPTTHMTFRDLGRPHGFWRTMGYTGCDDLVACGDNVTDGGLIALASAFAATS